MHSLDFDYLVPTGKTKKLSSLTVLLPFTVYGVASVADVAGYVGFAVVGTITAGILQAVLVLRLVVSVADYNRRHQLRSSLHTEGEADLPLFVGLIGAVAYLLPLFTAVTIAEPAFRVLLGLMGLIGAYACSRLLMNEVANEVLQVDETLYNLLREFAKKDKLLSPVDLPEWLFLLNIPEWYLWAKKSAKGADLKWRLLRRKRNRMQLEVVRSNVDVSGNVRRYDQLRKHLYELPPYLMQHEAGLENLYRLVSKISQNS